MAGNHSRDKGAAGEREICRIITQHTGVPMIRNKDQDRAGGCDIIVDPSVPDVRIYGSMYGLNHMSIEIKRSAALTDSIIEMWWTQTKHQAKGSGNYPVLFYRKDRQSWKVRTELLQIIPGWPKGQSFTVSINTWLALLTEGKL